MNEKSKRNIILIIIAVFVIATGLISLAMYNITKSSGKKNSKNTTATMSDAGSITTEAGITEVAKDSTEDSSTTEQTTTTEEGKDSKATTEAVASGGSKKDESSSNPKPSSNSSSNNNSNSGSTSGGNNNSGNQKPNNSSSGSSSSSSSGSGSTNPSNGNSSSNSSSNSGNNSSSSSGSGNNNSSSSSSNNNSQSSCSHNWVQVFIHHDQVKHTEYYTTTEIIGYHSFCRGCNLDLTETYGSPTCSEAVGHLINCNASYEGRPIYQEKQVPYDVIDQEAYDEPAGYKCSICGATR